MYFAFNDVFIIIPLHFFFFYILCMACFIPGNNDVDFELVFDFIQRQASKWTSQGQRVLGRLIELTSNNILYKHNF